MISRDKPGRPAETFAKYGYEGASISDLATAMEISPQSLYAAFGSKAGLYAAALDWYADELGTVTDDMLDRPDAIATLCG